MKNLSRTILDETIAAMFSNMEYKNNYLFYAHIIGQCSIKLTDQLLAPAGVSYNIDHYNLYINPEMFDKFLLTERLAILKHETLHILMGHLEMYKDEGLRIAEAGNKELKNIAYDCAINQLIDSQHLPGTCITPKTLQERLKVKVKEKEISEYYYELLKKEAEAGNPAFQSNEGMPNLMDDHDEWENSKGDKELQQDLTKKMIEKAQSETIKSKGTVPHDCSDWLKLHTRKSEVNWKKVLRGIVGNKRVGRRSTIMKADRRFPKREDLRGKTKDRVFNLLVVADVSGSMSDNAVLQTLGEVRHICDVTKTDVDLIQIDTQAYPPEKLNKRTKLVERKGCGGTDLHPALTTAKEKNIDFQAVVVLTDGGLFDGDIDHFQALGKKVIWLIEPSGTVLEDMNTGRMKAYKLKDNTE